MDINISLCKKIACLQAKKIVRIWLGHQTVIFIALVFLAGGLGIYVWLTNMRESVWSEERKQEYLHSNDTSVRLKEGNLKNVMESIDQRAASFEASPPIKRNIFSNQ